MRNTDHTKKRGMIPGAPVSNKIPSIKTLYFYFLIVYFLGCGIIYLIIAGSVKSFGVLYTELLDYYEAGAGNTAWISSVCLFLFMGLGIFSLCTICA